MVEPRARQHGAPLEAPRPFSLTRLRGLAADVALPWIALQLLERVWNVPVVPALAVASLFPALSIVLSWIWHRRLDVIGMAVLLTMLGGIAVALMINDPRFAVLKAAPGFGLFGIACLLSLTRARPLMFFVGRQWSAGGDPATAAAWTARLKNPGFRRSMRMLTIVWGTACLVEAALGIATAFALPTGTALVLEPVLGVGTVTGLLAWTLAYARRRSARVSAADSSQPAPV
jgi:hypothetical protein